MANQILAHPFDANLMLRQVSDGNLTATGNTTSKAVFGMIEDGLAVQIVIPSAGGTSPTLAAAVQLSTDNVTFNTVAQNVGGTRTNVAADGEVWVIPFVMPAGRYYVRVAFTVAGTTPNFGAVSAGVIPNPGADYDRSDHWL